MHTRFRILGATIPTPLERCQLPLMRHGPSFASASNAILAAAAEGSRSRNIEHLKRAGLRAIAMQYRLEPADLIWRGACRND